MEKKENMTRKIERVCIIGNQHGLLQYLLLSSLDEISHTFFLWSKIGISGSLINKISKQNASIPEQHMTGIKILDSLIKVFRFLFDYYIYYPLKFPFLLRKGIEYWGQDHVYKAYCLLRNHSFHLIEDGIFNYGPYIFPQPSLGLKRLLIGRHYGEFLQYAGNEKRCLSIHLTGLVDRGDVLKDPKVIIKSFVEMWNNSDNRKRQFINDAFGISVKLISDYSRFKQILLTQPFSEIDVITEEQKIDMYKDIIERIGSRDIVIKPHPRETTNYSAYFEDSLVLSSRIPIQLLSLNGIIFERAYSINSTALFDFPYHIKVCVLGSEVYPALYEKHPEWVSKNVKITNKNVELFQLPNK